MRETVSRSPSPVSMEARIIAICVCCVATEARESPRIFEALALLLCMSFVEVLLFLHAYATNICR